MESNQLTIPYEAKLIARASDPETSHDAAKKMVKGGKLTRQQELVYSALVVYDRPQGFTFKELPIQEGRCLSESTCWKRLGELGRKNMAYFLKDNDGNLIKRNGKRCWRAII
ncbi:MAG: hypothetical protein WC441_04710 [Patescibacteria group bacterium]